MKIITTMIHAKLEANLLLFLFCPFVESYNKNQVFIKMVICGNEKFLFFVYSVSV